MCLLQFKKEQLDESRKMTVLKNSSFKNVFNFVVLKQKSCF